jgi:hypothetical protein
MFEKRRRPLDPHAEAFAEIDETWGERGWYLRAVEQTLRDNPET